MRIFQIIQGDHCDMVMWGAFCPGKPYPAKRLKMGKEFPMTNDVLKKVKKAVVGHNEKLPDGKVWFIREKINGSWVVVR
jgi:hypothetical protein